MKKHSITQMFLLFTLFFGLLYLATGAVLITNKYNLKKKPRNPSDTIHVIYNGLDFPSTRDMEIYQADMAINKFYPQYKSIPNDVIFIFSAMAWSCIGVLLGQLFRNEENNILGKRMIIGCITGLIIWVVIRFTPSVFVGQPKINQNYIFFLATLSGLFTDKFMKWLDELSGGFFSTKKSKENES